MTKTHYLTILLAILLLTGCATSKKGGQVSPSPYKVGNELSINFQKYKKRQWNYPLPGAHVISAFGGKRPNHKGTDIKTKARDKVRAAFEGTVTFSGEMRGYGKVVFISHPNGLETRYAHNSKNIAKTGKKVKPGDVIALEGKTGNATTEHVHFETRVYGQAFDSERIFNHNANELRKVTLTAKKNNNGNVSIQVK